MLVVSTPNRGLGRANTNVQPQNRHSAEDKTYQKRQLPSHQPPPTAACCRDVGEDILLARAPRHQVYSSRVEGMDEHWCAIPIQAVGVSRRQKRPGALPRHRKIPKSACWYQQPSIRERCHGHIQRDKHYWPPLHLRIQSRAPHSKEIDMERSRSNARKIVRSRNTLLGTIAFTTRSRTIATPSSWVWSSNTSKLWIGST
jgi:hypothetical protein